MERAEKYQVTKEPPISIEYYILGVGGRWEKVLEIYFANRLCQFPHRRAACAVNKENKQTNFI